MANPTNSSRLATSRLAAFGFCFGVAACAGPEAPRDDVASLDADSDVGLFDVAGGTAPDTVVADAVVADASDLTSTVGAGSAEVIKVSDSTRILLRGRILSPDNAFDGEVLIDGAQIVCAAPTCADHVGADDATTIATHGIIVPGLIDMHNHILFDIFDDSDWLPTKVYTNHKQWTAEPGYIAMLDVKQCLTWASQGRPAWCPDRFSTADGRLTCEMDKWGELKGMIAGTTSIVGLPGTSAACFGSLSRSIDVAQNDLGSDKVQTSALFPPSSGSGVCTNVLADKTRAYLIHCGEGTDATARAEFAKLGSITDPANCLYMPQTTITHGTAFTDVEFHAMANAGMKLTWSPASNVALYGATTDIPAALAAGVVVTLGPDWSMGGSQNMLDELRFADAWDNAHWGDVLSPKDLLLMATVNGAAALSLADKLGRIEPGYLADLFVIPGDSALPYDAVLAATPSDVELVMVGGRILYGAASLQDAVPSFPACEHVNLCGKDKFLCVSEGFATDKLNQTYAELEAALQSALIDVDAVSGASHKFAPVAPLVHCP